MHLKFIKIHLIIFEIISTILFLIIFGSLFYYSIIYKNYASMKKDNDIAHLNILFSANYSRGVYSDVDIKIYSQNTDMQLYYIVKIIIWVKQMIK